jgi:hypothetical protein
MPSLEYQIIEEFIKNNIIEIFYSKRIANLEKIQLSKILRSKNPYLFKAKNIDTASDLIRSILDAVISSSEETVFGNLLEELAIFVNGLLFNGKKSTAKGIDLEFEKDNILYLVAIKSGPNWGNSSQVKKMIADFISAKKTLRTSNSNNKQIEFINGCCYGKDNIPEKGEYLKMCGQRFWSLISGDEDFYLKIIKPIDSQTKQKDEIFKEKYAVKLNLLTQELLKDYCVDGKINWDRILEFNSGKSTVPRM